jgi:hypothetical protein
MQTRSLQHFVLIAFALLLGLGIPDHSFAQSWYSTSWTYRKSHVITGSSGAGTNYQVRIVAHKATGTDSGPEVYLGTNVKDDFGDIRFTSSDGTTLLDYWLETGSLASGSAAAFWVEVAADLGSNQSIYIYYGNSSASTTSNGTTTFILFDDFTGASLDGSKWTKQNGGTIQFNTPSAGLMTVPANATDPAKLVAIGGGTADNQAIVARFEVTGGTGADERVGVGLRTVNSTSPKGYNYVFRDLTSLTKQYFLDDAVAWSAVISYTWSKSTFYKLESFTDGTNIYGRTNYGAWNSYALASFSTTILPANYYALNIGSSDGVTVWDWAFIRKCIVTEPAHSTWSSQENVSSYIHTWGLAGWTYRKCHFINQTIGAGTNYQVAVTVNYGSGTDNGSNIYCNSHCQTDFSDMRFTSSDGSTLLSYWLQSYTASSSAIFWVKVSANLSNAQTIYIYYGKSGETTTSSGANTFILFDDGSSVGSWSVNGAAGATTGTGDPQPSYYANGGTGNYLSRNGNLAPGTLTTFNIYTQTGNLGNFFFLCNLSGSGQMYRSDSRGTPNYSGFATTTSWTSWMAPTSGFFSTANAWYKFAIAITSSTSATLYYQQTIDATPNLPSTALAAYTIANNGGYIGLVGDAANANYYTYWDNIITRKYVNPEPTQSACGVEETVLVVTTAQTNVSCNGGNNGAVTASVSGGTAPYAYLWSNGQTTPGITGLTAGTYTVNVTDNIGQMATASATVTQPSAVTVVSSSSVNISCFGGSNGTIIITAGGGTSPYQYSIFNGSTGTYQSSNTFTGLSAGTYKIRVKDNIGCESPACQ